LAQESSEEVKIDVAQVEEEAFKAPENAEHFKFEAEVSRMLDIVVNSLYQNKDVFLRELISNASDALDKMRFLSLTNPNYLTGEDQLKVEIEFDPEQNVLIVRDTGIGMMHDELVENLGTVARSGTTRFMQALKDKGESSNGMSGDVSQIGQFGVGFYSSFLVADRVQVASKHPDSDTQWVWTSANGASEFEIFPDPRGSTLTRGSEVTLFLKEDALEYADQYRLEQLAKHYSEFVIHPIYLRTIETMEVEVEDDEEEDATPEDADEEKPEGEEDDLEVSDEEDAEEEEAEKPKKMKEVTTFEFKHLNGSPAVWTRSKEDIEDEEYQSFYKLIAKDESIQAATWTHFQAEGNINFKSILYLPAEVPQSWKSGGMTNDDATGLSLYVQKVLISDEFAILPKYLSFMKGVVDSDDLPLNVNRETLQESKIIQVIRKKVVRKALEMIKKYIDEGEKATESDDEEENSITGKAGEYKDWVTKFAPSMKMGCLEDEPNRGKIMKLLRYKSTTSGDVLTSLPTYVENMKEWQKEVFFVAGIDEETVKKSQFLEPFLEKGVEVLYFIDPVDEYLVQQVQSYDGKKFVNIASDSVKFRDEEDTDLATRREKFYKEKFKPLTKWLKTLYGSSVMRVAISKRLVSSPAIASSAEFGHSANMERIMRAQAYSHGQHDFAMMSMKIFEINPRHPLILKLLEGAPSDEEDAETVVDPEIENAAWILHEMALLNGGFQLTDPEAHSNRMMKFISSSLGVESTELAPEPELPVEEDEPPEFEDIFDDEPKGSSPEDAIPLTPDEFGNIEL
jgi:heat shock protein beta